VEQSPGGTPVEGGLVVSVDGVVRRQLAPGDRVLTFGRSREGPTHLHVGPVSGRGDHAISRIAGSVRWCAGQWMLRNESETRPFVVVVGAAQRIPMAPATLAWFSQWAVGPDGVVIELPTPTATYEIALWPVAGLGADDPVVLHSSGPSTTPPFPVATPHERLVLAAKFLSRRRPGTAVGDERAAERATRALGTGKVITAKAVENVVGRWRRRLEEICLPDVAGRSNVDRVGAYLLAFGVLTEDDRLDLPPDDEDDPRG
jgi:hypothetical protein